MKPLLTFLLLAAAVSGCAKSTKSTSPGVSGGGTNDRYTIEQTISDGAQRNTIAFDGLAFMTGSVGAQSFLPPGKVADYSGFQYLRDNDPTNLGHNTDFVTIVAFNVLNILNEAQVQKLVTASQAQVTQINQFALQRYPLLDAFRRELDADRPAGKTSLDSLAVAQYTSQLYVLDGVISYGRARVMSQVLLSLDANQRQQMSALKALNGVGNWNRTLTDPLQALHLDHDVNVAVMTYASEMYAWYAGTIESDTYFCPERQGTYFGSFYLKDWPAMGNPNYTINEQLTASAGEDFLRALPAAQATYVTGLVDVQKSALLELVERRRAISTELRKFLAGQVADSAAVMALSARYGELDGSLSYSYAMRFAAVWQSLDTPHRASLDSLAHNLGYVDPTGGFLYSAPVTMPAYGSTDFLFGTSGGSGFTSFTVTSSGVTSGTLAAAYTCDGAGVSPPLAWSGAPEGTASYAVVMHHIDPEGVVKWYWVLYDLPASVTSLAEAQTGLGTLGTNSVNGQVGWEPPCSQGPGPKTYVITVYALSAPPALSVPAAEVTRAVLLDAIADRTLGSAQLEVTYSR